MREHPGYDGFIISTLPDEHSRWLRMDLPRKVEQQYGKPVIHVKTSSDQMEFLFPPIVN